jgi:hypothetical protein
MVNIFKLIEYLASRIYNIMFKVQEYSYFPHYTCGDNICEPAVDLGGGCEEIGRSDISE